MLSILALLFNFTKIKLTLVHQTPDNVSNSKISNLRYLLATHRHVQKE